MEIATRPATVSGHRRPKDMCSPGTNQSLQTRVSVA